MKSVNSIETYAYGPSKDLICKKEKTKRNDLIKQYNNVYLWLYYKRRHQKHNPNWPKIPDHLYRILIIGGSRSGKTNALLNLINHESDIDKIYLYIKDTYELLISVTN